MPHDGTHYTTYKKNQQIFQRTYRNVHQMLKHIVFNQKKAAKKKKCMQTAESRKTEYN